MFPRLLALEGFKSFPEWNGLELSPGISVLVGLNGTGKSNVTDAISWHRPPPTLERLLLLEPAERRRTIEEAAGIPHVSVQAAALSAERDDLRLEREHVAGELEHARRTLPGLEEEDL